MGRRFDPSGEPGEGPPVFDESDLDLMMARTAGESHPQFSFYCPRRLRDAAEGSAADNRQDLSHWIRVTIFRRLRAEGRL